MSDKKKLLFCSTVFQLPPLVYYILEIYVVNCLTELFI